MASVQSTATIRPMLAGRERAISAGARSGLSELFLWGPRQVLSGIGKLRRGLALRQVNRERAAKILGRAASLDQGG
jgi:hypothetical protein